MYQDDMRTYRFALIDNASGRKIKTEEIYSNSGNFTTMLNILDAEYIAKHGRDPYEDEVRWEYEAGPVGHGPTWRE